MPEVLGGVPWWFLKALALVLGAAFGSFANVLIYRLPTGQSLVRPGSRCPSCGQAIRWYDNIPIVSYLCLMGRCRACRASISLRYPLVELCTAVLSLASLYRATAWAGPGASLAGIASLWAFVFAFCFLLVVITFIDIEHWRIPPALSGSGALLGVLFAVSAGDLTGVRWTASLAGAALGALPLVVLIEGYRRLAGREGMGYGDVFLMGMVGAYLGYPSLPFIFFASSLQGLLVAVPAVLAKGRPTPPWERKPSEEDSPGSPRALRHVPIPFGPFIALAALEWLFFGDLVRTFVPWPG